jgi:hypothetical protein
MKSPVRVEDKLARLRILRETLPATTGDEIASALNDEVHFVAVAAAELAEELELRPLAPKLLETLQNLLDGKRTDPGCRLATAVVRALAKLEVEAYDIYLRAMRLVRVERSGTSFIDVAIPVRIGAGEALVNSRRGAAVLDLIPLLGDSASEVRAGGVAVLGMLRADAALAAIFTKLVAGDDSPEVVGACMAALTRADPGRFVPIVAPFLDSEHDSIAELAAIALGDSRAAAALPPLKAAISRCARGRRARTFYLAVSLLRSDDSINYLLGVVREAPEIAAILAVEALRIHRDLPSLVERLEGAVATRRIKKLTHAFRTAFELDANNV